MKRSYFITACIITITASALMIGCGKTNEELVSDSETEVIAEEIEPEAVETVEPKEEVTEPKEETKVVEETAEPAKEAEEAPEVIEEKEEEAPVYTYTDTSATMYAKSTVNVRDIPDKSGNKVGSLAQNEEATVTGKCNETGWYRIDYKGSVAYVSNSFLVTEKVEVEQAVENNQATETNPPAKNGGSGSGVYSNEWGQTWTMSYEDVVAAFGQPVGVFIQDSDTTGYYYAVYSHIRGVNGNVFMDLATDLSSKGWYISPDNDTRKDTVMSYDNGLWDVMIRRYYKQ